MPEKDNEIYHIVSMDWWEDWKNYTFYDNQDNHGTNSSLATTNQDDNT